jgi:hypothetical protein
LAAYVTVSFLYCLPPSLFVSSFLIICSLLQSYVHSAFLCRYLAFSPIFFPVCFRCLSFTSVHIPFTALILSRPPWETRARGFFLSFFSPFKAVVRWLATVEKWKGWAWWSEFSCWVICFDLLTLGFWLRLGFDSGRPGAGSSFLLCSLREGYADVEACCKVEFGFGLCVSKRGIVLFVHVPRRLPSVPSNGSCYGYSFVNNIYLFICKSHITCLVSE